MNTHVASIAFPDLPLAALKRKGIDVHLKATAVIQGGVVIWANASARRLGALPSTPLAALPSVVACHRRAKDFEAQIKAEIGQKLRELTQRVEEDGEGWIIDFSQSEPVVAPALTFDRLWRDLADLSGVFPVGGLGPNRLVAQVARGAALSAGSGWLRVMPGGEARFMAPLSIDLLPQLNGEDRTTLKQAGIATIGDIASTSAARLVALCGPQAMGWRALSRGVDPSRIEMEPIPPSLGHRFFPENGDDMAAVQRRVVEICRAWHAALQAEGLAPSTLHLEIVDRDGLQRSRMIRLPQQPLGPVDLTLLVVRELERLGRGMGVWREVVLEVADAEVPDREATSWHEGQMGSEGRRGGHRQRKGGAVLPLVQGQS